MNQKEYDIARKFGRSAFYCGMKDNPYAGVIECLSQCIAWANGWVEAEKGTVREPSND